MRHILFPVDARDPPERARRDGKASPR